MTKHKNSSEFNAGFVRLNNWSIKSGSNPYVAPENRILYLQGEVEGHPHFEDGSVVSTSMVMSVTGRWVRTHSRLYYLMNVNPDYLKWCRDNNQHIPEGDYPIKCL